MMVSPFNVFDSIDDLAVTFLPEMTGQFNHTILCKQGRNNCVNASILKLPTPQLRSQLNQTALPQKNEHLLLCLHYCFQTNVENL